MVLKGRINEDLKAALKSGSNDVVLILRFLSSVIKNKELEKRTKLSKEGKPQDELEKLSELTDEEVTDTILGEIKKIKDSMSQYEKGGRKDLVQKGTAELEVLKKYVPEKMTEKELKNEA